MIIYLDESGDLGWKFDMPYGNGGSSRYLTITYIIVPDEKKEILRRIIKKTYQNFNLDKSFEHKGTKLKTHQRDYFIDKVIAFLKNNQDVKLGTITVSKEKVYDYIRKDGNKLYNYMINLGFIDTISLYDGNVLLLRDNRTIKVKSGNSLIDYLQTKLWFEKKSKVTIIDKPTDSASNYNLLFIDWISYMIWCKYEYKNEKYFDLLKDYMVIKELYF